MKFKSKKAQLSMSFNWIFVLIAGIIFLTFFFSIISNQTKNSEQKVAAVVAKQFETILETTAQKTGTFKKYRTSPIQLDFVCDGQEALSYYDIGGKHGGLTSYDVMFTPPTLYGNEFYTWTQDWDYPFKVTNFLYITNKVHMFIFFKPTEISSQKVNKLEDEFPLNLTISHVNKTYWPKPILNNDRYTYILFAKQVPDFDLAWDNKIIKEDSNLIIIDPTYTKDIFFTGTVYFLDSSEYKARIKGTIENSYKKFDNSTYFGAASLFGAIFTGEKQSYECNMQKAFNRLDMLNKLHIYRINSFMPHISKVSNCNYLYNGTGDLDGMKQLVVKYENQTRNGFYGLDTNKFISLVEDIKAKNTRISFEARCPVLY